MGILTSNRRAVGTAAAAAGERDRLVTIQMLAESKGLSNYPVESWQALTTVWASRGDMGGTEQFAENQQSAPYQVVFTIPWMDSMDPDLVNVPKARRLVVKNRVYDIVGAAEVGRRNGIELMTVSGGLVE